MFENNHELILCPPQMFVIKLNIKEMRFKNVDYLAHAL